MSYVINFSFYVKKGHDRDYVFLGYLPTQLGILLAFVHLVCPNTHDVITGDVSL